MKKFTLLILSCCMILGILSLTENQKVFAAQTFTPAVLTTGSASDYAAAKKSATYRFTSDGSETFQLNVPKDGSLEWELLAVKSEQVNLCIHNKADASDLPVYAAFACTADRGNTFTLRQYIKKGTYYLKFPKMQNSYVLTLIQYSSEGGTITSGSTVAGYCDAAVYLANSSIPFISNTYSYKAAQTGYLTMEKKNLVDISASMSISFYEGKKKITDFSSDHDISGLITFPVKKGTSYKIRVGVLKDGQQFYQMKFNFVPLSEKSGSSKTNAKQIRLKRNIKGMVYAEEPVTKQDWYKFNNTRKQDLKITYTGGSISGSIDLLVYDKNMKKLGTYHVMPMINNVSTKNIRNKNKGLQLEKGTYYIKVVKNKKETAGYYDFKIHP